jgi:formamidopyrimidine-DNA glycosylase
VVVPELPDVVAYQTALTRQVVGAKLQRIVVKSPFLLRTFDPPLDQAEGKVVAGIRRLGKRLIWELTDGPFLVFHLMIAGRLHWQAGRVLPRRPVDLAAFQFAGGTLLFTEASKKKRASLHVITTAAELKQFDRGGIDPLTADLASFREALLRENHTLKRSLTDPRLFDGIGNAYSDEILHAARLSPATWTRRLTDEEIERLHVATRLTLQCWLGELVSEAAVKFPDKVTAFRPGMAVHGKFGKPCPVCGTKVQRIVYAENETNYCPRCQTGGKLLADRSLSRLLKDDWPRTIDELEAP